MSEGEGAECFLPFRVPGGFGLLEFSRFSSMAWKIMQAAVPQLRQYFTTCAAIFAPIAIALALISQREGYGFDELVSGDPHAHPSATVPTAEELATENGTTVGEALSVEFERLVDKVIPSVARIDTMIERKYLSVIMDTAMKDQPFRGPEYESLPGVGSGVIVNPSGDILTNYHVIKEVDQTNNRDQIWVSIYGETEPRQADIVGMDPLMDIALLRLRKPDTKKFSALPFGNSDQMKMGNIVMAFGSPWGLSETATQGIISNCKRRMGDSPEDTQMIQTDVVINPGSSGGPLVNLKGEIVGIIYALYAGQTDVRSWQGISLAIPSNDAKASLAKLLDTKQLRGYVGLTFADDSSAYTDHRTVTIAVTTPGSPAAIAGLKAGDVVSKIDGTAVMKEEEAWNRVKRKKVGETIIFDVSRSGTELPPIEVTVLDMDQDGPIPPKPVDLTKELGILVKDGDPRELRILKTRGWVHGQNFVIVTEITPDSPLAKQDKPEDFMLRPGDVIRAAGLDKEPMKPLNSSAEMAEILKKWKKDVTLTLNVWRNQNSMSTNIKLTH